MKRGIILTLIIVAAVIGFLAVRGTMPFMPIFGSSMEPTLRSGDLMIIEPIEANEVEVGDIIVYNVPSMIRDYYNYPPVVAHRVVKINTPARGSVSFRTKGDNTGEDPFSIMPRDLRGTVGTQIPYLGLPLLFLQSQQGLIFTVIALSLLGIFLYGGELSQSGRMLQRGIFFPVIQESYRTNRVLSNKIDTTEQRMDATQDALVKFSEAIGEYAKHLASHTSAIQGLSEASQELRKSSAEQNRVLMNLVEKMGEPAKPAQEKEAKEEIVLKIEGGTLEDVKKKLFPPGCARNQQEPREGNNYRDLHSKN
ncbi:signal peptidase I [Chloroflexota bacterium]